MSNGENKQRPREQSPPLVSVNELAVALFRDMYRDNPATDVPTLANRALDVAEAFVAVQKQRLSGE